MASMASPMGNPTQWVGGPSAGAPGQNQFFNNNAPPAYTPGNTPGMFPAIDNSSGSAPNPGNGGAAGVWPTTASPTAMGTGSTAGTNPYQIPGYSGSTYNPSGLQAVDSSSNLGHGVIATGLQYPGLSNQMANYLMSQIGAGLNPYDLTTQLPTGGQTMPGQLSAGMNPLLAQLQNFFMTGQSGGMPGMSTMSNIANNGISALPEWQSMVQAQQQNIQQNQANLQEQFAGMGDLAGSPFGTAMSNYMQGTTASQNALLGQLQQQNILQGQLPLLQSLFSGSQSMAGGLQSLDQQAIQNNLSEFNYIQPQNNPMLPYLQAMSSLYPPTNKTPTTWDQINSTLGALNGAGYSSGSNSPNGSGPSISF